MTGENGVTFGFDNNLTTVCDNKDNIKATFDSVFTWSFTEKSNLKCDGGFRETGEEITYVEGYFVGQDTYEPKDRIQIASMYDNQYDILKAELIEKASVTLDPKRGFQGATHDYGLWANPEKISWIIVGGISGFLVLITSIFLLSAYCLRTNALERKVKALDTDAVVTENAEKKHDKIFLSALTDNVPNSNEFAESGANPIWQAAMESNDFEDEDFKFDDAVSESSGDSIFIGVEDQTEFQDYAAKLKEVEVDMDLYNKVQGTRYKKMDDYQVDDDEIATGTKTTNNPMFGQSDYL